MCTLTNTLAPALALLAWESERIELFHTSNPGSPSPAWRHVTTVRPRRAGAQVVHATLPLGTSGRQAIRARLLRNPVWSVFVPLPCGTSETVNVVDDHDDLAFEVAP